MAIEKAENVIDLGDLAIVIFTRGELLKQDALGNGETGNWVVDKATLDDVNKVILYLRNDEAGENRILLGNYVGVRKSPEPKRYIIRFAGMKEVGTTESNWNDFADAGQNPISYVGEFM